MRIESVARASLFAVLIALPLIARTAHADEATPFTIGSKPAWYVLAGPTFGGTVVADERGWFVGGEASVVRLREGKFFGFYGDGYYDFGARRTYATGGLELGYKFLGLDAGAASRFGGSRPEWGPTGRLFISTGLVTLYGRYAHFVDALGHGNDNVVQFGALLKIPVAAWGL